MTLARNVAMTICSFATGWNYFFKYVVLLPNNLTAAGLILQYWAPNINVGVWVTIFGILVIFANVRGDCVEPNI